MVDIGRRLCQRVRVRCCVARVNECIHVRTQWSAGVETWGRNLKPMVALTVTGS